jgi:hypothetical protein
MSTKTVSFFWVVGLIATFLLLSQLGHCSSVENRPNSLGVAQVYESPYTYTVGSPVKVDLFEEKGQYYTNVAFKPFGTSMLNTQVLLFCGSQEDFFTDSQLRAVIYRINATRKYEGIGCHDLLRVLLIKEEK